MANLPMSLGSLHNPPSPHPSVHEHKKGEVSETSIGETVKGVAIVAIAAITIVSVVAVFFFLPPAGAVTLSIVILLTSANLILYLLGHKFQEKKIEVPNGDSLELKEDLQAETQQSTGENGHRDAVPQGTVIRTIDLEKT